MYSHSSVCICLAISIICAGCLRKAYDYPQESLVTASGRSVLIGMVNHGSLSIEYNGVLIYVDPVSVNGRCDYTLMPKADYVFFTHPHYDHFDKLTLKEISKPSTVVVAPEGCAIEGDVRHVLKNGDELLLRDTRTLSNGFQAL